MLFFGFPIHLMRKLIHRKLWNDCIPCFTIGVVMYVFVLAFWNFNLGSCK